MELNLIRGFLKIGATMGFPLIAAPGRTSLEAMKIHDIMHLHQTK
jgi:hypothetical protein